MLRLLRPRRVFNPRPEALGQSPYAAVGPLPVVAAPPAVAAPVAPAGAAAPAMPAAQAAPAAAVNPADVLVGRLRAKLRLARRRTRRLVKRIAELTEVAASLREPLVRMSVGPPESPRVSPGCSPRPCGLWHSWERACWC